MELVDKELSEPYNVVRPCKLDPGLKAPLVSKVQPNERETCFQHSFKLEPDFLSLRHYNVFTYRYFINNWPQLCFLAYVSDKCIGEEWCGVSTAVRESFVKMRLRLEILLVGFIPKKRKTIGKNRKESESAGGVSPSPNAYNEGFPNCVVCKLKKN